MSAERAHHFGLVNVLCERGEALSKARELASWIDVNAPLAVVASRQVMYAAQSEDEDASWRLSDEALTRVMSSNDIREGLTAFIEKRSPRWTGRQNGRSRTVDLLPAVSFHFGASPWGGTKPHPANAIETSKSRVDPPANVASTSGHFRPVSS